MVARSRLHRVALHEGMFIIGAETYPPHRLNSVILSAAKDLAPTAFFTLVYLQLFHSQHPKRRRKK